MADEIYIAGIRDYGWILSDGSYISDLLPKCRIAKLTSYTEYTDRLRSLVASLMLVKIFGLRVADVTTDLYGKPSIAGERHFNISHSGEYVLLAVSDKRVGVDIEYRETITDSLRLAQECFHPEELSMINSINAESRIRFFYDTWVLKESYMKMTGLGLSMDPRSFSVYSGVGMISECGRDSLWLYNDFEDYSIALCSLSGESKKEIVRLDLI